MIRYYYKTIKEKVLVKLEDKDNPWEKKGIWIDIENPTEQELKHIIKHFPLKEDLLNDALDLHEVPRLEFEQGTIYIFTRVPITEDKDIITTPLLIAIHNNFIATLCAKQISILDKFRENKIKFYTTQKIKFLVQIFSQINNEYTKFINNIEKTLRNLTVNIERIENKDIVQFVQFERILNDFYSSLNANDIMLENVLSGKYFSLYETDKDLIEDLFISNKQLLQRTNLLLKNIVNAREAYSTIMQNNLNKTIKLLTAITIVFTIPTIIASIYGMNVGLPLQNSPFAFLIIILITLTASLLMLAIFMIKKWL